MQFFDDQGRELDVEVDFNSDGSAYYSGAVHMDDGSKCDDTVFEYLEETYPEYLEESVHIRREHAADMMFDERR